MASLTEEGVSETQPESGLSTKGYHYAHDKSYYKDGRFCEPPKAVAADTTTETQASQSKWNFKDYHWEERDIMATVKERLSAKLVGTELWRDKKSGDCLTVSTCDIVGWAVSNVRKGSTKNVWEFAASIVFEGTRGDTQLRVTVTAPGLEHDLLVDAQNAGTEVVLPAFAVASEPGENVVKSKSVDASGNLIEVVVGEANPERVLKNNEMFLKLVNKKGLPLIQEALIALLNDILTYGQQQDTESRD